MGVWKPFNRMAADASLAALRRGTETSVMPADRAPLFRNEHAVRGFRIAVPAALSLVFVIAACTPPPAEPPPQAARERSTARTLDAYKREAATRIVQTSAGSVADALPPMLKSVVVLDITVDRDGRPVIVSVRRSNGHRELEQAAIASVRRAGPLPAPPPEILKGASAVSYVETWLFRADGRFQVRSIAGIQPGAG
jgi:protein TonB